MKKAWIIKLSILGSFVLSTYLFKPPTSYHFMMVTLLCAVFFLSYVIVNPRSQFFVKTIYSAKKKKRHDLSPMEQHETGSSSINLNQYSLTFDDGPDPEVTPAVLDLLKKYGAKASFFVVGKRAETHPHLLRRMIDEGHCVGTHTFSHSPFFHFGPKDKMRNEIHLGIESVERCINLKPLFFRPPQGLRTPPLQDALRSFPKLRCVTWTASGRDSMSAHPRQILSRLETKIAPGAILALHDGRGLGGSWKREATLVALETILMKARRKKLRCTTLEELLGESAYETDDSCKPCEAQPSRFSDHLNRTLRC